MNYQRMIHGYADTEQWSEFVHQPYLLEYCEQKNIQWDDNSNWILIRKQRSTRYISTFNKHLLEFLKKELKSFFGWKVWDYEENRVVVENCDLDFVFDIWNHKDEYWSIEFFKRKVNDIENSLKPLVDSSWTFNGERYEKRLSIVAQNHYAYPNVIETLENIINILRIN